MARRLKAQPGTDEANFGGAAYRVDNDGFVNVPDEAAAPLVERGGFVDMTEPPSDHSGEVFSSPVCRMRAPDNAGAISWNGASFEADEAGVVAVPPAAAPDLAAHGFVLIED